MTQNGAKFTKTRLAPTPSGYLHLGNVLSFSITAALAQQAGAKVLLRIDDLDRDRVNKAYVQDIFDTLNFLQIPWHEGPLNYDDYAQNWSQLHRMDSYQAGLQLLKDRDAVFACTCSRAQIQAAGTGGGYPGTCLHQQMPLNQDNASWRLKTDDTKLTAKTPDGDINTALSPDIQHFVVRKKDGYPAYQLTSVLDDLYFGVDFIVRGADLWASTLAQLYLAPFIDAADFRKITFYHHPLLMADGDEKLSKSAGATSVHYLRSQGKSPADIFSAIAAMLGFHQRVSSWQGLAQLINIS